MVYFCCINVCIPCWYLFFVGGIWHGPVTGVPQSSHGPKERFPWSPLGGLRELELKTNQPATEKIVVSGVRTSCFCQEKLHVKLKGPVGFLTDSEPVTFLASHFRSLGSKVPNWLAHYALPKDRNGGVGQVAFCSCFVGQDGDIWHYIANHPDLHFHMQNASWLWWGVGIEVLPGLSRATWSLFGSQALWWIEL